MWFNDWPEGGGAVPQCVNCNGAEATTIGADRVGASHCSEYDMSNENTIEHGLFVGVSCPHGRLCRVFPNE